MFLSSLDLRLNFKNKNLIDKFIEITIDFKVSKYVFYTEQYNPNVNENNLQNWRFHKAKFND